jgi:hypothetical protein
VIILEISKGKDGNKQIPAISRNISLLTRLVPTALCEFDSVLDKNGKLYFRLLCRLTDEAYDEFNSARDFIIKEFETQNKLNYRFYIINHVETSLNAINRAARTFKASMKDNSNVLKYMSTESFEKIKNFDTSTVRNRIEHIDEDIQEGKFSGPIFLAIDDNYQQIGINSRWIAFQDIVFMIETYYNAVSEIFTNLPNRQEKGHLYHDNVLIQ